ncbi:hypothetical protein GA0111570_106202 [Raineyella antarctica]|uniref:Uncharacterized protein n=1 Tax=Raineyella antarctica TaxID=1577474 RepID=A0A1G6H4I5_9ACTN|nr:hypothetical protein [Raineyella antarctica]SDB89209.1 hypothetical protein GA0111570_106202 [Raineyella antarctica]
MDSFVVHIDRRRWADMRRNSRIGLIGSILIGIGGGAWLIFASFLGDSHTSVVPGILLVVLGIGAGLSFRSKRETPIHEDGPPVLFTLDRTGVHLDPGAGTDRIDREWGDFELNWLHRSASYLELSSSGSPAMQWPVVVTDANRGDLGQAVVELSEGRASLGNGTRPRHRPAA